MSSRCTESLYPSTFYYPMSSSCKLCTLCRQMVLVQPKPHYLALVLRNQDAQAVFIFIFIFFLFFFHSPLCTPFRYNHIVTLQQLFTCFSAASVPQDSLSSSMNKYRSHYSCTFLMLQFQVLRNRLRVCVLFVHVL
eukprot:m.81605 g.81605  ORF g.81605 m.81605 type:complete len:136 (+) comp12646_c0_seq2:1502-1909(+)